ncbi:MAG: four helix bundle protein [Candidatus Daviesbacteria bacterium]|nr:four helix bundle protein [Candidatus Daviesbacteria bacterium]
MQEKIQSFTDLNAWKEAHKLALLVYRLTSDFPISEKYSLIDQMRRAAVSISSNIAEGFSRQSNKEKLQFYYTAKGSLTELQNQLLLSQDIGYIKKDIFNKIAEQTVVVGKLLTGLIKAIKSRS